MWFFKRQLFSIYFLFTTSVSSFFKRLSLIFIGVLCVFGLFNYLPSGILLIVALSVLLLIDTDKVKNILLLCLGLLLGIIVYHLFIRNIVDSVNDIYTSFVLAQKGLTKHSNNQLFVALFRYLVEFVLVFGLFAYNCRKNSYSTLLKIVRTLSYKVILSKKIINFLSKTKK